MNNHDEGNKEALSFEQALDKLEKIVEDLETGEAPLEKAIELFQEGMSLSGFCHQKLQRAEQQVQMITEQDGQLVHKEFELGEDGE